MEERGALAYVADGRDGGRDDQRVLGIVIEARATKGTLRIPAQPHPQARALLWHARRGCTRVRACVQGDVRIICRLARGLHS